MFWSHQVFQNSALSPLVSMVALAPFLFSVIGRTSFWLAAPTSRAPWGLVVGRRVLSFFFFRGSFSSPQRARSVFLLSAVWLKVQSESNPRTGFGILRCFYSFARPFSLAS